MRIISGRVVSGSPARSPVDESSLAYQLDVLVAAENARPLAKTVSISLSGDWHPDETRMLRDGIGLGIM
jgi:hypothetical protein